MKEIKLYNRDGANLRLVSEDGKVWKFHVDKDHQYVLDYCRLGLFADNIIGCGGYEMIDPSGGPYLKVGERLDNMHIIESIKYILLSNQTPEKTARYR